MQIAALDARASEGKFLLAQRLKHLSAKTQCNYIVSCREQELTTQFHSNIHGFINLGQY